MLWRMTDDGQKDDMIDFERFLTYDMLFAYSISFNTMFEFSSLPRDNCDVPQISLNQSS